MISFKDGLIETASFTPYPFQQNSAWIGHLPFAAWLILTIEPKVFVELGSHWGHSYFSFCQSVNEANLATKCYAIDTWQGDEHAGNYSDEVFNHVNTHNQAHYADFSRLLRMAFDDAVSYFSDGSIGLLHIDGLHTYEAVKHDFETWLPKLAPGAVVLFHDTNVHERGFGVWKLWEELQACYPNNIEFLHSHGLGVLQLDGAADVKKPPWLNLDSIEEQQLKDYFSALGARQLERFELSQIKTCVTNLNQAMVKRDGQITNLNQAIIERDGQIAALYGATSWRITRPLRIVAHQMKRIRRVSELAMPAIKLGGGLKNTLKIAMQLYRREGLAGIKRGFRIIATNPMQGFGEYDRNDYTEWIRRYDTLTDEARAAMRVRIDGFSNRPLISVVMPTYNPKSEWLIEAIESVRKQIYPHWELCVADDASTDKAVRPILESYAKKDARIKVIFREQNGHISAASNSALKLVTGAWVALLDHDDLLSEHALFWVANVIQQNPDVRLIYSDEDKIDEVGRRSGPYFKCDWNEALFYSHNFISHLGVYRADILQDIGGFRVGLEGSQDYDLALRCIERSTPEQIYHIPRVLYHWRIHAGSTAQSLDTKPYCILAGERALNEHFQRQGINGKAEFVDCGYRVRYALPDIAPMVSLIIPTKNGLQLICQCVKSILEKTTYPNYEILIIDNGSDEPAVLQYFASLAHNPKIRILHDAQPFNYSALNNAAIKAARGEYIALINNDIEVISPDWLGEMLSIAVQPGVGAVGARLWYPNDTLQHGGVILGILGAAGHAHRYLPRDAGGYFGRANLIQTLSAVTAACLLIKKSIYDEVGGLDEPNLKVAFNDVDLCLKVRQAGYLNVWSPYAELYHHESATRGLDDTPEKQLRAAMEVQYLKQQWGDLLLNDPAYSPNLTLNYEDFSLAWPPRVEHL